MDNDWLNAPLTSPGYTADGRSLLITAVVLTLTSLILYILRAITASKKEGRWRADFLWISVAMTFSLAAFVVLEMSIYYGLGHHIGDLTYPQISYSMRYAIFYMELILVSTTMAKFSIIALLIPVQGINGRIRVHVLWALGVLQGVFALLLMIFIITECHPISHLWDVLSPGVCPRKDFTHRWGIAQGAVSALVDFCLALWPLSMVPTLQVSMKAKVAFCLLMGLGMITGFASILRDVFTQRSVEGIDLTYTYNKLLLWTLIEQTGIIILGTVPTLRPFFRRVLGRNSSNRTPHSRGYLQQITGNGIFNGTAASVYGPRAELGAELDEVPFARDKGAINVSTSYSVRVGDESRRQV